MVLTYILLSSKTNSAEPQTFIDRIESLLETGNRDQATTLAREVVKLTNDVSIDFRPSCIVVETPHFEGTHDYAIEKGELVIAERGEYRYRSDEHQFRFAVYSLNPSVREEAYSDEFTRGDGSEDGADGSRSTAGVDRSYLGKMLEPIIDRLTGRWGR